MKGLVWKEWTENRNIVAMSALLMVGLFIGFMEFFLHDSESRVHFIGISDFVILIVFFWSVPAALCSVSMIAPEVGSGTLQLLSSIPISRSKIWWTKLSVAFLVLALSDLIAFFALEICCTISIHANLLNCDPHTYIGEVASQTLVGLLISLPIFAIGSFASALTDNTITALIVVVVAAASAFVVVNWGSGLIQQGQTDIGMALVIALVALLSLICFMWSFLIFKKGESLKTPKRFVLLFDSKIVDIMTIIAALIISYIWLVN